MDWRTKSRGTHQRADDGGAGDDKAEVGRSREWGYGRRAPKERWLRCGSAVVGSRATVDASGLGCLAGSRP